MTTSGQQRPAPDQIVVANGHVDLVRRKLNGLEPAGARAERSDELGLTLIDLHPAAVAAAARRLRAEDPAKTEHALRHGVVAGGPSSDLTIVLDDLYRQFADDPAYGGWVPVMGTNRVVVGPAHNINGGGEGDPRTSQGPLLQRPAELGAFVRIGLADTALFLHPQLDGSCLAARSQRWSAAETGGTPVASGHGTFVAGLILQQAPGALVIAEQILDAQGQADSWDVAKSLVRFARSDVAVLNLSIECITADGRPPLVLSTAIDRLGFGVQVVAAAGNHDPRSTDSNPRSPVWPAAFDDVLAVAAHDADDRVPEWSTAADLPWVDCLAAGVDVVSTYPPLDLSDVRDGAAGPDGRTDPLAAWSGTSFAAATVTGLVAAEIGSTGADARAATARLLRDAKENVAGKPILD